MSPNTEIALISFSDWEAWDKIFRTKVKISDLWAYIDPIIDGEKLIEKPLKPKVLNFLRYEKGMPQEMPTSIVFGVN